MYWPCHGYASWARGLRWIRSANSPTVLEEEKIGIMRQLRMLDELQLVAGWNVVLGITPRVSRQSGIWNDMIGMFYLYYGQVAREADP